MGILVHVMQLIMAVDVLAITNVMEIMAVLVIILVTVTPVPVT